jgi:hypothetical protein
MPSSYGINNPRQAVGRPVSARTINAASALSERLARMRAGRGLKQSAVDGVPIFELEGSFAAHFHTPVGGIPHMTGSPPTFTPGSEVCEQYIFNGADYVATGGFEVVYNDHPSVAVGGNKLIQAKKIDGAWVADYEPCT